MIKTNAVAALTNSVLFEIDDAATFLKELKNQGYLPGVPSATDITITTGQQPASELKGLQHPFVSTFLVTVAEDSFTNHYTVMHPTMAAPWQLERAWRTDAEGRTIEEWQVNSVPQFHVTVPLEDLTNLAAMQDEVSSHQAIRGPLMHELRAATRFLTELGRTGRLPGMFAHHGHEQVTTDTLPFKALEYPFAATFCVNEVGESFTNHYTLAQSAKGAPWQLQRAWRTTGAYSQAPTVLLLRCNHERCSASRAFEAGFTLALGQLVGCRAHSAWAARGMEVLSGDSEEFPSACLVAVERTQTDPAKPFG